MNGSFTKVEMPAEVKVGDKIPLRVGYTALNPGALYWSTAIMAKMGTGPPMIVSTTREIGQEGGGEHSYSLMVMPTTKQTITVRLFGHDDAGHQWSGVDWVA